MARIPLENINELDFDVAKENFLSFVKNNSEFGDYDYEASGLNFLVDLLAYNTQYNAFYLNQLSSKRFYFTDSIIHEIKCFNVYVQNLLS